jgi:hypothetical protein
MWAIASRKMRGAGYVALVGKQKKTGACASENVQEKTAGTTSTGTRGEEHSAYPGMQ